MMKKLTLVAGLLIILGLLGYHSARSDFDFGGCNH